MTLDLRIAGGGKAGCDVSNPRPLAGVAARFTGVFVPDDTIAIAAGNVDACHAGTDIE